MKLWYQSLSREDASSYHEVVRTILDSVKDRDTEIEVHGITKRGGVTVTYRYLEYLQTGEVMENLQTAMRRGFDAFLIGNIVDAGLHECREITNIPVLGLCETTMHLACMMGANFSLVTINDKFTPRILENVARCSLEHRLVAVNKMGIDRTHDLDTGFDDTEARDRHIRRFMEAANIGVDAGAEVVIPAGGLVMALLAHAGVHAAGRGAPIVNGITALVKMGEMAVKLDRIMGGRFTSKRCAYAPPGSDQIDEIRKYYGDVYSTVKGTRHSSE